MADELIDNTAPIAVGAGAPVALYTGTPKPSKVTVQNLGPNAIFIGGSTVTAVKGVRILNGGDMEDTAASGEELYAITAAGAADVRVLFDQRTPEAD